MSTKSYDTEVNPPAIAVEAKVSACDELYESVREDIHDMLDFVRAEGKPVPDDLRAKVAELCYGEPEASKETGAESTTEKSPPVAGTQAAELSLALEIHGRLSQLVAPANPRTIRASRLTGRFKFFADNATVKSLIFVSILSLLVFLSVAVYQAAMEVHAEMQGQKGATSASPGLSTTNATEVSTNQVKPSTPSKSSAADSSFGKTFAKTEMDIFMILAAASLGSAFYGLYTAHKYIVTCTFDPKYHQVYLIRYVLGLTSGTILGFFGKDLNLHLNGANTQQLGAAVLALVGGYAAEAVSQILQRFAETLVTVVRGSNDDVLQAKEGELQAKAKQQETQTKNELVKGLLKAKDAAVSAGGPNSDVVKEIQKQIDALSK